jgi:hypothetical protein
VIPRIHLGRGKRKLTKAQRRERADQVAQQRKVRPDARTVFVAVQARRAEVEAKGGTFRNVIDERGAWV